MENNKQQGQRFAYGSFEEYMLLQLKKLMKQKNKESWAVKRIAAGGSLKYRIV
ncbi:hypothetical protein M3201_17630 [Paenibacillus motobuensis]|uniref:hypothetical protein n=1 Tax=Paenibacillus TaxID=44249 RepID=UPI00203E9717|nr:MULTISPECIES: hypothetical protein [Paenibacillus]MCM3041517.1 hypothetical protein [Paenibacillus lutimineralis]MCM3648621.1 hypothetical protein [Paenibacillus motobuensis]